MPDSQKMDLMLDISGFSVFRPKKLPPRGHVEEERTYFDLGTWCITAIAHNLKFPAIYNNLCPCNRSRLTCGQPKARHARDARQGFAAKAQCAYGLKIGG